MRCPRGRAELADEADGYPGGRAEPGWERSTLEVGRSLAGSAAP